MFGAYPSSAGFAHLTGKSRIPAWNSALKKSKKFGTCFSFRALNIRIQVSVLNTIPVIHHCGSKSFCTTGCSTDFFEDPGASKLSFLKFLR